MNKVNLVIIRDGKVTLRLPQATIRDDGTVWANDIPLLDGKAAGALPKDQAAAAVRAKAWDKIPASMYTKIGTSPSGLIVRAEAEYLAEQRAARDQEQRAYDLAHPGAAERREIDAMFAHAFARRDAADDSNTMDYYRISAGASAKLKAWRVKYPAEAREEDAAELRAKADHQRSLAAGALAYDCDGSLDNAAQQKRHDEFLAQAVELEKQAADLLAK